MSCGAKEAGGVYRPSPRLRPGKSSPHGNTPLHKLACRAVAFAEADRALLPGVRGGLRGALPGALWLLAADDHALVTKVVLLQDATFVPLPRLATGPFLKLWEGGLRAPMAEGKITKALVANIRSWKHSGFSVDQSVRLEAGDQEGVQRLIQYFLRCHFSQTRMIEVIQKMLRYCELGQESSAQGPPAAQARAVV